MSGLLYAIFLKLFNLGAQIKALFDPKAKQWLVGRSNINEQISSAFTPEDRPVWMHCASVGEFEQGRPILETIHRDYPNRPVLLTFFSPSGYEQFKNYPKANLVTYLPMDSNANVRAFLDRANPSLALFVKYEIWPNMLDELDQRKIPAILFSANFVPDQLYFKSYGQLFKSALQTFNVIHVQNEDSRALLAQKGISNVKVSGDTRADRVLAIAQEAWSDDVIKEFCQGHQVFIAGSVWPADIEVLESVMVSFPSIKLIVAPHEMDESFFKQLEERLEDVSRYSSRNLRKSDRVLLMDQIGMLSRIYRYADFAYVGGGFGSNIHNILEPAVYGVPVLIGPKNQYFLEAQKLKEVGCAFELEKPGDAGRVLKELEREERLNQCKKAAETYFKSQAGSSQRILEDLRTHLA